jgi:hypothetical protein
MKYSLLSSLEVKNVLYNEWQMMKCAAYVRKLNGVLLLI